MMTAPNVCPQCGQIDLIVKITSPQAPRVLPITDLEITQAARQLNPEHATVAPAPAPARGANPSGCLVAVLIVVGIGLFMAGSLYGVYHPLCPEGELVKNYSVPGAPIFQPHCLDGGVVYEPQKDYILPGGAIISPILQWGGGGLFLWGFILPIVGWFRRRSQRQEQLRIQTQSTASLNTTNQQVLEAQVGRARMRVDAAYYCGRDDGFFIPGYPHFYRRGEWAHFLFG